MQIMFKNINYPDLWFSIVYYPETRSEDYDTQRKTRINKIPNNCSCKRLFLPLFLI